MIDLLILAVVAAGGWYAYRNRAAVKAWIANKLAKRS